MSDDIPSLVEAMAEIRRLREQLDQLKGLMRQANQIWGAENDRLHAKLAERDAAAAMQRGTLERPTEPTEPTEPTRFTWNVPPSAPPHNE